MWRKGNGNDKATATAMAARDSETRPHVTPPMLSTRANDQRKTTLETSTNIFAKHFASCRCVCFCRYSHLQLNVSFPQLSYKFAKCFYFPASRLAPGKGCSVICLFFYTIYFFTRRKDAISYSSSYIHNSIIWQYLAYSCTCMYMCFHTNTAAFETLGICWWEDGDPPSDMRIINQNQT